MFVELTVPLGEFGLIRRSRLPQGTNVEFEQTASILGSSGPSIIVSGPDHEAVFTSIQESPSIATITIIGRSDSELHARFSWTDPVPRVLEVIDEARGDVISAVASGEEWSIGLRFPDQQSAAELYASDETIRNLLTIRRASETSFSAPSTASSLTVQQREALEHAHRSGYFRVPREVTLDELAQQFEISDSAMSQRIRRGLGTVLQTRPGTEFDGVERSRSDD